MKIGIYLAKISQQLGGGARFQKQVVDGLLDSPSDHHEYCLFGHEQSSDFGRPLVVVDEPASPTRAQRLLNRAGLADTESDRIAPILREHQIDV